MDEDEVNFDEIRASRIGAVLYDTFESLIKLL